MLRKLQEMKVTDLCTACRRCDTAELAFSSIFAPLRCPAIYPAGAIVFGEGQSPTSIHVVCQGRMGLSLTSKKGKVAVLRTFGSGEIAGICDVLANAPSQTRGTALTTSEISSIPATAFRKVMKSDANAAMAVAILLAKEVRYDRERMAEVTLVPSVRLRFIDFLRDIGSKGRRTSAGIEVIFPYSQAQIAEHLACTRETVGRLMSDFTHAGAIVRHGATLLLVNDFEQQLLQKTVAPSHCC